MACMYREQAAFFSICIFSVFVCLLDYLNFQFAVSWISFFFSFCFEILLTFDATYAGRLGFKIDVCWAGQGVAVSAVGETILCWEWREWIL